MHWVNYRELTDFRSQRPLHGLDIDFGPIAGSLCDLHFVRQDLHRFAQWFKAFNVLAFGCQLDRRSTDSGALGHRGGNQHMRFDFLLQR